MKKILLSSMLCASLFAQKTVLMQTPPADVKYVNLELNLCNDMCLKQLLYDGLYISYLARFNSQDDELEKIYNLLLNGKDYIQLPKQSKLDDIKIAILIPEKIIKSYANSIISPSTAYLLNTQANVHLNVFYTGDENPQKIAEILPALSKYNLIITGFQNEGINYLSQNINNVKIFNPLAKKENFPNIGINVYFGSISYDEQIASLLNYANENIVIFKDQSLLGSSLSNMINEQAYVKSTYVVNQNNSNINALVKDNIKLNNASIFFNLPLIKTTLIATQIRANELSPKIYLSTQINYSPSFLSLTQENERNMFYFANSIGKIEPILEYYNNLLGQNIAYNWIAYSTSVGLDYLFNETYNSDKKYFDEDFINNQIYYKINIMNAKNSKFTQVR
ncbi:hypothetical protein AVCANL277_04050 [Campylobacter canadensis]|uniref:hypothetical protein n=1 Tax=Campylobacter canadensis TaxID=449520 RepID=UPI001CCB3C30|nr:hypothetical protein [Campylobacter canadensis]MBZ8000037.1 hypothetical protein [Campylobacter canadensis]